MKKTNLITIVILSCLVLFGIFSCLSGEDGSEKEEYEDSLKLAQDYMSRGLYQLAIEQYDKAISIKDSEELRDAEIEAYQKRYAESDKILSSYIDSVKNANAKYNANVKYYILLADLYIEDGNYQSAYKCLKKAVDNGIENSEVNSLLNKVKYFFKTDWSTYDKFLPCTEETYAVMNAERWSFIDENGNSKSSEEYSYVSQIGDEGIRITAEEQAILEDEKNIVRGKLSFIPVSASIYSEGLIAINNGKSVGYYDSLGDFQFGEFLYAGKFQNGKAPVKKTENEWVLINKEGKELSSNKYQDIKLDLNNGYITNKIMIAKTGNLYSFFDESENKIGSFTCENIDVITDDGLIAFEQDKKWGFVNTKGEIIIEPRYEDAKSFSNGLAAISQAGKWGFIDSNGVLVIDCQFFDADYFNTQKSCMVKVDDAHWQLISLVVDF